MPDTARPEYTNKVRVDISRPDPSVIQNAGKILSNNGIVIFPAACLYGVAANALSPKAVEKVFHIKQRPKDNPILVLIRDTDDLNTLVKSVPKAAQRLMDRFWPGSITLIFEAANHISPILTAGTGKIGIRLPGHPIAQALVHAVDFPITGTSANLSGKPGCIDPYRLPASIVNEADLILDSGKVKGGIGSSIVDVTCNPIKIVREGAVSANDINLALA
ncbi:MAG: threonylcarbamoyl-AMP synthase [Desulfobacterales bacterium]|nr:threonylcarbamoyl-AMP synthase [Desulfobacterales bacterium]